jgi:hypothetical protein
MANRQLRAAFLKNLFATEGFAATNHTIHAAFSPARISTVYQLPAIVALHQGIRPQFAITWKWNCAIWMPGNEAQKRARWARGTPG